MKYVSTRGSAPPRRFSDILLEGLAPDGGLYVPERYPRTGAAQLQQWRALPYRALAFEILSLYIDDIPRDDLRRIVDATYTAAAFGSQDIVPLRPLEPGLLLLGLSNGPTLAFKDIALQLVGNLFAYELARRGERLNVVGATSGDTGSAAEHALKGKGNIAVFMLSPKGRMTAFQQAQMFSLQDAAIHNLVVDGSFDDCQDIVKAIGGDAAFKRRHAIGAVNSINWARVLAQVVYYAWGWLRATDGAEPQPVDFCVPSGNFGNICAGHVARMMGVPIGRLVLATNENDVLAEFFAGGRYRPRAAAETHATSSPSMDIARASNLERFVFDVVGRDGARTAALFGAGAFALTAAETARLPESGFVAGSSTHADRIATIRLTLDMSGVVVDPHTADALTVARRLRRPGVTMVALETALPAKFAATIREAIGRDPDVPPALRGIEALPRRVVELPADVSAVRAYVEAHAL